MKTAFLVTLLVGLSSAAMQPRRTPVYQPQVTSTGSTANVNGTPLTATSAQMTPAPMPPVSPQPVAQARESIASEASIVQPSVVNPTTPSQVCARIAKKNSHINWFKHLFSLFEGKVKFFLVALGMGAIIFIVIICCSLALPLCQQKSYYFMSASYCFVIMAGAQVTWQTKWVIITFFLDVLTKMLLIWGISENHFPPR